MKTETLALVSTIGGYTAAGVSVICAIARTTWNHHLIQKIGLGTGVAGTLIGTAATAAGLFALFAVFVGFVTSGKLDEDIGSRCLKFTGHSALIFTISSAALIALGGGGILMRALSFLVRIR